MDHASTLCAQHVGWLLVRENIFRNNPVCILQQSLDNFTFLGNETHTTQIENYDIRTLSAPEIGSHIDGGMMVISYPKLLNFSKLYLRC